MNQFAETVEFRTPNLSAVPDGEYKAVFRSGVVRAKVRVSVSSSRITSVEILRHFNGQGEAAEGIADSIVEAQGVEVDTVAGATYSSEVILKAVESALVKGAS